MKSINGTYINGNAVPAESFPPYVDASIVVDRIFPSVPDYVASGTVELSTGETVECMEIGRTKNGYARLILSDGREIKTDPTRYREAGSIVPFFVAFPYACVPGMVPYVAE